MAEPIKFTELTNAGELSLSAIMAIVQQQAGELVSLQCSMAQVAELVASGVTYQELTTEQKTLISAINEIATGGGGGGGAYFFAEGQATAEQIRERYNSGLMCFLIANDDTIYPLTAIDAEYIQGERVEGVFFAKAFGYGDNISVNVKYIQNDAGVEVSSVGFTGIANSRITSDMSTTNGKIPTDDAVRAYVTEYIRTRLAQKLDLDLNNISTAGEQKIRDIAGGGGGGDVTKAYVDEQNALQDVEITKNKDSLTELNEVKADKTVLAETNRNVDLIFRITQNQSWMFVDQTEHGMNVAPKGTKVQSLLSVEGKSEQNSTNGYNLATVSDWSNTQTDSNTTLNFSVGAYLGNTPVTSSRIIKPITSNGHYSYVADFSNDDFDRIRIRHNGVSRDLLIEDIITSDKSKFTVSLDVEGFNPSVVGGIVIKKLMLEKGSTAHDFEPYTGGIPSPNPDYPQEITSVEALNFSVEKDGEITTHTIIPPFALNKIGDYADLADVVRGVWVKNISDKIDGSGFTFSVSESRWRFNANNLKQKTDTAVCYSLCNMYQYTTYSVNPYYRTGSNSSSNTILIYDTADADLTGLAIYSVCEIATEIAINAEDLSFLKSLQNLDEDNVITITDQNGNDITYAMKYLIKLSEAI